MKQILTDTLMNFVRPENPACRRFGALFASNIGMKLTTILCFSGILGLTSILAEDLGPPIRILCVGDSITQGGSEKRQEYTYRFALYRMIESMGVNVDFVGSQTRGSDANFAWPADFDADHEAYGGCGVAEVRNRLQRTLPTFEPPDIVLIHLGTNDQEHHHNFTRHIGQPLADMIDLLRVRNPAVVILVAHLNFNGGKSLKTRPVLEKVAGEKHTAQSPVVTVKHFEGWVENPRRAGHDCHDWVHPNPRGEQKMAEKWFAAMIPFLGLDKSRFHKPSREVVAN